jgi:hypothetical protein
MTLSSNGGKAFDYSRTANSSELELIEGGGTLIERVIDMDRCLHDDVERTEGYERLSPDDDPEMGAAVNLISLLCSLWFLTCIMVLRQMSTQTIWLAAQIVPPSLLTYFS